MATQKELIAELKADVKKIINKLDELEGAVEAKENEDKEKPVRDAVSKCAAGR